MSRIVSIIGGTGEQGFGIALRLAKAGEKILIGSRDKKRAQEAALKIKKMVKNADVDGMANKDAAKNGDVIILSVPLHALANILNDIKPYLKNKIVVDVTNPLAGFLTGDYTKNIQLWEGSAIEFCRNCVKDAKWVKALNNIRSVALHDLNKPVDCDVVVCSDHQDAKKVIMELVEKIEGVRAIDGGPLENSRIVEQLTALLLYLEQKNKVPYVGLKFTGI
ncbi:MAG: NADPH-dependent F420 reductase [Candidatus Aenigmatarchaeota archaeon]